VAQDFDVAVVGGGSAGLAAALSAARLGARTLLAERSDVLGGNASLAYVHTICGLYRADDEGEAVPANPGLAGRFADALRAAGAAGRPERAGRVWVLPTYPPRLSAVALDLCAQVRELELRMRCALLGAQATGSGWELSLAGGARATARIAVDASGDAALAALAGAEHQQAGPGALQLPSFIFRLGGVDTRELGGFARLRVTHAVAGAARRGQLPEDCASVLVRTGAEPGEVYVTLNVPRPDGFDPLDEAQRGQLEAEARKAAEAVAGFLRAARPDFAGSRVLDFAPRIGVRETRRVTGRDVLTRDHVLDGREPPDAVAISTWPIELWQDHRRPHFTYPRAACGVPLGALVSRSHPRLGMAGRCLSADHEALGALRVIGTALATGEAVGVASALAADAGTALDAVPAARVREHKAVLAGRWP
jgi:hypothetical protein